MNEWLTTGFWELIIRRTVEWLITSIPSILVIIVFAIVALKLTSFSLKRIKVLMLKRIKSDNDTQNNEQEKRIDTLLGILTSTARIVIWVLIAMLLLRKLGVDIAPLIAGAGIAGLAVGFGAQEMVRDVISGFFMLLENQVRTGDVVVVNGTAGLVESVGLRTIILRDLSGVVHIFQNGKINTLSNMTKEWSAMVFDIGVAFKEDTDNVVEVMKQASAEMLSDPAYKDRILEPLEIFGVDSFGESSIIIKARFRTKPGQQWDVGREYRRRLKKAFKAQNIEIPFPHRTIYWGAHINPLEVNSGTGTIKKN